MAGNGVSVGPILRDKVVSWIVRSTVYQTNITTSGFVHTMDDEPSLPRVEIEKLSLNVPSQENKMEGLLSRPGVKVVPYREIFCEIQSK